VATGIFSSIAALSTKKKTEPVSVDKRIEAPPTSEKSSKSKWNWTPAAYAAAAGGALLAGVAGTAYYKREDLGAGYSWATDHMRYIGALWDESALNKRVDDLLNVEEHFGITFRT
jgi:hypothetical protein